MDNETKRTGTEPESTSLDGDGKSHVPFKERLFLSVRQAVEFSGLTRTQLFEEMASERINSTMRGRRRLVSVASLIDYMSDDPASEAS